MEGEKIDGSTQPPLEPAAFSVYRPLPQDVLGLTEVLRFVASDIWTDLRWVAAMAVAVGVLGAATPYLVGQAFDKAIPEADPRGLLGLAVALLCSGLAVSAFKLVEGTAAVRIQARMSATLQAAVWDRVLNLPTSFFRGFAAGDLADRAQGIDAIQELVSGACTSAVLGAINAAFFVVQMLSIDPRMAVYALGISTVLVIFSAMATAWQLRYQRRELDLRGRVAGLVLSLVGGVPKIRLCGAEPHAFRAWAEPFAAQRTLGARVGAVQNLMAVFSTAYPLAASIGLFYAMAGGLVPADSTHAAMTTGGFIAFTTAFALFSSSLQSLSDAAFGALKTVPIYERLVPILTAPLEVDGSSSVPARLQGGIRLSHVYFRYQPDGPWIIEDLSLVIEPGQFVAFVGLSGCGKSTLIRLLLGFEVPTSGSISYDGQDLRSLDLRLLRRQIGVVLQSSRVMPTDLLRNIVGATGAGESEAWLAAEHAGLADDIRAMPMKMSTHVSEGGGTLSGGQRQRLMVARAIVNNPRLLFLDEATSALDNLTQAVVTRSLEAIGATRVVVAHRLSTIMKADTICFLEAGTIKESGTYADLMKSSTRFASLVERQIFQ